MKKYATILAALAAMIWMNGCGGQDPVSSQSEGSDSPAAKLVVSRTKAGRGLGAGKTNKESTAFSAVITGNQEVPAVTTKASGTGNFTLNAAKTELRFEITATDLSFRWISSAEFHNGAPGVNAGVVRRITTSEIKRVDYETWRITGIWSGKDAQPLTPALVKELEAGNIYVNICNAAYKSGEIRGQLMHQ